MIVNLFSKLEFKFRGRNAYKEGGMERSRY
jgi:hypothetical protein